VYVLVHWSIGLRELKEDWRNLDQKICKSVLI
jgi:hypothetical protein